MKEGEQPDLSGQVVVVTGANPGVGLETSVALAAMGARVVMACRDAGRAATAHADVIHRSGSRDVEVASLDLASFESIHRFAEGFLATHDRLDVLINNAGLTLDERAETSDGFEMTFGVNHLGHFLLTDLLRDRLVATAPARVVVVASLAHRLKRGGINFDDLQSHRSYRGFGAYSQSKLANVMFALELARQLKDSAVAVNAVHPGSINSNFGGDGDSGFMGWGISTFGKAVLATPEQGARTSVLLASSNEVPVLGATGGYWSHGRRWKPSRRARDLDQAARLWEVSEKLIAGAS